MDTQIILVLMLLSVLLVGFQKKKITEFFLLDLHKTYKENVDMFFNKIDSFAGRLILPTFTRELMKLNHYIKTNDKKEVDLISEMMRKMKLRNSDNVALSQKLFAYYLENDYYSQAEKNFRMLQKITKNSSDIQTKILLYDMDLAFDVHANKNVNRITELTELINDVKDNEMRSIYYYRLAILYKVTGDFNRYISSLQKANELTSNYASKKKISQIIKEEECVK
ncbi:MAG: hypothetical protein VB009_02635 [Erysipelotrichaceae bacterium]|nr:hypothetical protein [Erysipelotrichaceae bacterium]